MTIETTPPALIWTAVLDQNVALPLVVIGKTVIIAARPSGSTPEHGSLHAISLSDGRLRWQHTFEYALVSGMQAYRLNAEQKEIVVVAVSSSNFLKGEGAILAFDETGAIFWRWPDAGQHYAAPVVVDRQIVIAGGKDLLIISPEQEGDDAERIPLPATAALSAPAVHDGVAYVPCRGPELLAVSLAGEMRWHFHYSGSKRDWLDKTPVLAADSIFAASSLGMLYALERESGNLQWKTAVGENRPLGQPVIHDGRLYVGHHDGLDALDTRNGRTLWTFSTPRPVSAAPLVIHDTIYVTDENHFLHALDLETGAVRWQYELERRIETPPLLTELALLIADHGGHIAALERPSFPKTAADGLPETTIAEKRAVAQALLAQNQPLQAADIWLELGDLAQSASAYEAGKSWQKAADLWQKLDRYGKRAKALARHAEAVSQKDVAGEKKAAAWQQAARAFAESGEKEARLKAEREIARYRQQALLSVGIAPEADMILNAWSRLNFTVHNTGFGAARRLHVSLKDDRFEGQTAHTQTIITLQPDRNYTHWLDVIPRAYGSDVPMQLVIEYVDKANNIHTLERTFYLEVKPETGMLSLSSSPDSSTGTQELAELPQVDGRNLYDLREKLTEYFSKDELTDIIFELGLRAGDFSERLSTMARELVIGLAENGRLDDLIAICQERRPKVAW